MVRVPCFKRPVLVSLAILAMLSTVWGPPLRSQELSGAEIAPRLASLTTKAPVVETLAARYRIDSTSIVEGVESRYSRQGRFYYERGDDGRARVAVYRDLGTVAEMQLLLRNGELVRYFPLSGYGHHVVAGSWDKDRTDFSRFWRPFLAHIDPQTAVETAAGALRFDDSKVEIRPDREADRAARAGSSALEYWGPAPDVDLIFDAASERLTRLDRDLYRASRSRPGEADLYSRSAARLEALTVHDGILLPTRIAYQVTMRWHVAPYRTSTLELFDIKVGEPVPADAFAPVWPADTLLLDVEPQPPEAYLESPEDPRGDDPRIQVLLADYYLGTGQSAAGMGWLERFQGSLKGRLAKPSEVGNLARLLALAGRQEAGRRAHLEAIFAARELAAELGDKVAETELARYLGEYAYFIAYGSGPRLHEQAGSFLERQLAGVSTPLALARLATLAAHHYSLARRYDLAGDVLVATGKKIASDREAAALLEAGRLRLAEREGQNESAQRVRAKNEKIRALEARLTSLKSSGTETAEIEQIRDELEWLKTHP